MNDIRPSAGRLAPFLAVVVLLGLSSAASSRPRDLPAQPHSTDVLVVPLPPEAAPPAGRAPMHPEAAPPGHTGGFGEPTCHSCHFDGPIDDGEGWVSLNGLPDAVEAAGSYTIELRLVRPGMQRAGFQLTARFDDGSQAGSFELLDNRAQVVSADSSGVLYLTHTPAGTSVTRSGSTSWRVRWCPPEHLSGPTLFHAAANAANDDRSEFGDSIYTLEESIP